DQMSRDKPLYHFYHSSLESSLLRRVALYAMMHSPTQLRYLHALGIEPWQLRSPKAPDNTLEWQTLKNTVIACTACGLDKTRTQTVFGVGNLNASVMVIGEAPGFYEDKQGQPFVGRAGQLLNKMLAAMGFAREDVFIANILKCRPPNNRDPLPEEVD